MDAKATIKEEAVRWFLWLNEHGADKADVDVFMRWQNSAPEHKAAYQEVEALWTFCDSLDDLPWPTAKEILHDRYDASSPIPMPTALEQANLAHVAGHSPRGDSVSPMVQRVKSTWRLAAAASVLLVTGVTAVLTTGLWSQGKTVFETARINQGVYQLDDGSRLTLGPASKVSVDFTREKRSLILHKGEAYFEVAKDAQRPFVVDTGSSTVRAVGTAFNINKRSQQLTISVLEGVVRFKQKSDREVINTDVSLRQGQRVVYNTDAKKISKQDSVPPRASSWREGKLSYIDEPLKGIIDDVNRYSTEEFVIGDAAVGELLYTGTVFGHDITNWADALTKTFPVRMVKIEGRIMLLSPLDAAG